MIVRTDLTASLKTEVGRLVDDLRVRADTVDDVRELVEAQWQAAVDSERTAHDLETWREDLLNQIAVSWVLGCVFIRFCEDNQLVTAPMISGPGDWRRWAADNQIEFFRTHTDAGERGYLHHVFTQAATIPGLAEVFGSHNPLWQFGPSDDACRSLIERWRATNPDTGELVWNFTDPGWDTRFLGDLYQDLSEHAKKTYALLQTPDFVEAFILDRTLDPAIDEFGLTGPDNTGFRLIDPACGSGHFLLGAFQRLATRWHTKDPAAGKRAAAARALDCIYGIDLNPFAASIARFRLLVAALRFADVHILADAPNFNIHIAVGDSLLHGPTKGRLAGVLEFDEQQSRASQHLYATEDAERINHYLGLDYHAVVANPPYITPKDPAANSAYRLRYDTCSGKYSLSVPFMERLFDLTVRGAAGRPAGFVGQITSNSFMKREFGKKIIENYLATHVDLTYVIDTSGAYIPGHGTPTVILLGRNRTATSNPVRALLGIRGEPTSPKVPAEGVVWRSITTFIDNPGCENDYISAVDIDRKILGKHPWSLQGGAAAPLKLRIERGSTLLGVQAAAIGITSVTGEDAVFILGDHQLVERRSIERVRRLVVGDELRDWDTARGDLAIWSYDENFAVVHPSELHGHLEHLWPFRAAVSSRKRFGTLMLERGLHWHEWQELYPAKLRTHLSIVFAFVATHNHFVLDRGGNVFKQSAPVIKLPAGASEDDHRQLLGLLNSSIACFWMKQVFHNKGNGGIGGGIGDENWEPRHEFDGSKLKQFPVASGDVLPWSSAIDSAAVELNAALPDGVASRDVPSAAAMAESQERSAQLRARMVWLQEELDWRCMHLYGVIDTNLSIDPSKVFELEKGQRAFEIALARKIAAGESTTTWFARHHSEPVTAPPVHWPDWYRDVVERRLELIESDRFVNLLERPEYKRRWNWDSWDDLAHTALRNWLLARLEDVRYWPNAEPRSIAQLADTARHDSGFTQVAALYTSTNDVDHVTLINQLTTSDAVPYLAAWRYKDTGLRKRAAWERTWDLQRREDAGEDVGKIPVPPKYGSGDFRSSVIWTLRGKLDVPKERFITYPGLERDNDTTTIIGWAGWDHLQQAQALTSLYNQRRTNDGWTNDRLTPILAGLHELAPWLRQWHNTHDPNLGQGLSDYYTDYLTAELQRCNLTTDQLTTWHPPTKTPRKKKGST